MVLQALESAGMLNNSVLAFCSDNGGPLDHATNAPLRGGKHTMWEGGLKVTAWVYSPLFPVRADPTNPTGIYLYHSLSREISTKREEAD